MQTTPTASPADATSVADDPVDVATIRRTVDRALAIRAVLPRRQELDALRRPHGGHRVWRDQLDHLVRLAQLRHVEVQVMPTTVTDHAAAADGHPFTLLEPADGRSAAARAGGRIIGHRTEVRALEQRYGALRAQALTPADSTALITGLATSARSCPDLLQPPR